MEEHVLGGFIGTLCDITRGMFPPNWQTNKLHELNENLWLFFRPEIPGDGFLQRRLSDGKPTIFERCCENA